MQNRPSIFLSFIFSDKVSLQDQKKKGYISSPFPQACAIAACASPMGIGTDLGGSVRIPALFTGICGHKGSPGLVSDQGHFPPVCRGIVPYFSVGPMARHVEDLIEMFKVMATGSADVSQIDFDEQVTIIPLTNG
jgi:Asp-tRNA(Asn)/Glu-tRNA(Gln) amidotransferase A subunit family amidase